MKLVKRFGLLGLITLMAAGPAMARQNGEPRSWSLAEQQLKAMPVLELPAIDRGRLLAEDAARYTQSKGGGALRFALPITTTATLERDGRKLDLVDGGRLWQLGVHVPNASDLNFSIAYADLPKDATLHLFSRDRSWYQGPYTRDDLQSGARFWSPVLPGDAVVIEVHVPRATDRTELVLGAVNAGYRDLFGREGAPMLKQGSCNIDVVCPLGDSYRNEIRSVARYTINGTGLCTGTLMRDASSTFRPWFLTAAHCGISSESVADSLVFYWNFEAATCGALNGGSLNDNQAGSAFRARRVDVDMSLVELDATPDSAFNVHYAGWDRSGVAPTGSIHIHHPSGDEKAISFNDDALTTGNSCIGSGGTSSHWIIDNYEQGTTEQGSSGSGVWTQVPNPRVIGFLSGGGAACSGSNPNNQGDCYGKLSVAWDGPSADVRLKDWLGNGLASPPQTVDGSDLNTFTLTLGASDVDLCPAQSATVDVLVGEIGGFDGAVSLSLLGASGGLSGGFGINPVTPVSSSVLTLQAGAAPVGDYNLQVQGSSGVLQQTANLVAHVRSGAPGGVATPTAPIGTTQDRIPTFTWSAVAGASGYRLEVARDAAFTDRVLDIEVATTSWEGTALPASSTLHWRVTALNACGSAASSASASFTTNDQLCFTGPVAIPDGDTAGIMHRVHVDDAGVLADLDVSLRIDHTYVGDLSAVLVRTGGGSASLLDRPGVPASSFGCNKPNVDATFDDAAASAAESTCAATSPAIGGTLRPSTVLSDFNGRSLAGDWSLVFTDAETPDPGTLQRWCLLPTLQAGAGSNADLSALTLDAGALSPVFAPATTAYSADVGFATTSITVTPTLADANASQTVNGSVVASGAASAPIALNVGANPVSVVVTAENLSTTRTYTIAVTRAPDTSTPDIFHDGFE